MHLFSKNVGPTDRIVRIGLSALLTGASIYFSNQAIWLAVGLGIAALVFLITALISSCPLYLPFGISTRRLRKRQEPRQLG